MRKIDYVELEHRESRVLYKFNQKSDEKIRIDLKPENLDNYTGYICFQDNEKRYHIPMKVLFGEVNFTSEERDRYEVAGLLRDKLNDNERLEVDITSTIEEIVGTPIIYDRTESDVNGYSFYDLTSVSTWLFNGGRRCFFYGKELGMKNVKKSSRIQFSIDTLDGKKVDYFKEVNADGEEHIFILDTDRIGGIASENNLENLVAKCYLNMSLRKGLGEISYPLELKFLDLTRDREIYDKAEVSIDFGTSSTCISHGNNQMLHFADRVTEGSESEYENMTSFIVYNWERISKEWDGNAQHLPYIKKVPANLTTDQLRQDHGQGFGDGEDVKTLMKVPSREILGATISNIKELALEEKTERFRQYFEYKTSHDLKLGLTDEEELNPIEFYAYQIGRKLNSTVKRKVYTRYHLTMPVKYPDKAKENIKSSFEKGLKRSLPGNLQDKLRVSSKYNEPTAILGSLLMDHFNKMDKPKFFSIFDFGGGTLDYIFGVVRPVYEDKSFSLEDEGEYEAVIELFDFGWNNKCGGESILKRLAYKIYLQNIDALGTEVPILRPKTEAPDDRVNSILYGDDIKNRVNLEMIVEKVAREILYSIKLENINGKKVWTSSLLGKSEVEDSFEDEDLTLGSNTKVRDKVDYIYKKQDISFQTINSDNVKPFDLRVDVKDLIDFYRQIVDENIDGYKRKLEEVVKSQRVRKIGKELNLEVNSASFDIFMAGNSCRSKVVEVTMNEYFKYNEMKLVTSKRYSLKTAVARGYNFLNADYLVWDWKKEESNTGDAKSPLRYNILRKFANKSDIEIVIPKNSHYSGSFKLLCGLESNSNTFTIDYIESDHTIDRFNNEIRQKTVTIPDEIMEKYVKGKGKLHVYIDAYDYEKIVYTFGKKKAITDEMRDNIEAFKEKCVVDL